MAASDYLLPNLATGTFPDSTVTPLIDGQAFNETLQFDLNNIAAAPSTQPRFVYISNWWLGLASGKYTPTTPAAQEILGPQVQDARTYFLDPPPELGGGHFPLLDILGGLAANGVDVRVMGWVGMAIDKRYMFIAKIADQVETAAMTINAIKLLRASRVGNRAIMNVLAHPAGAVHLKMVVIRNGDTIIAYTGGIDFAPDRWSPKFPSIGDHTANYFWHDAMARVEGPAVQPIYECYRLTYNENLDPKRKRVVFFEGKPVESADTNDATLRINPWADLGITPPATGTQTVQSLRTVPIFKYTRTNRVQEVKAASFAGNGLYEIRDAWKNAISKATNYIYVEDQYFWSEEVLGAVGQALARGVKVILVTSGASDPRDPTFSPSFLGNALSKGLFQNSTPTPPTLNNVRMFTRWGDLLNILPPIVINSATASGSDFVLVTSGKADGAVKPNALVGTRAWIEIGSAQYPIIAHDAFKKGDGVTVTVSVPSGAPNPAAGANASLRCARAITVHTKVTIIDDTWAVIQSANCARRSLVSDYEHGVAFIDPSGTSVRDLRASLWAEAFNNTNVALFNNLDAALKGWNSTWGTAGGITLPTRPGAPIVPQNLEPIDLVAAEQFQMSAQDKEDYDTFSDFDAREAWGSFFLP
jgi:phosphatidylserine/phosphatidylglycerophosphate/cardiolipin synthase-like enzyme